MPNDRRDSITNFFQKRVANPLTRRNPLQTLLETTGRKSGEPRRTPLGGSRVGDQFWFVSEFGEKSQYVKNINANPNVRVRLAADGTTGPPIWCPTTIPTHGCATCRSSTASGCARSARTYSPSASI